PTRPVAPDTVRDVRAVGLMSVPLRYAANAKAMRTITTIPNLGFKIGRQTLPAIDIAVLKLPRPAPCATELTERFLAAQSIYSARRIANTKAKTSPPIAMACLIRNFHAEQSAAAADRRDSATGQRKQSAHHCRRAVHPGQPGDPRQHRDRTDREAPGGPYRAGSLRWIREPTAPPGRTHAMDAATH